MHEWTQRALDLLAGLTTHSRYPNDGRDQAYTRSYRAIRVVVGVLGLLLPILFIIGEAYYLRGGVHVRGSLSAYYHTSMQDVFVGGLCVIGFLLGTYMAGELQSWDFRASLIAGIAVLGVVFFPTSRSGLRPADPQCGAIPSPPGCSFVEQSLGEARTALIHGVCAVAFIACLAVMSLLFAAAEVRPAGPLTGTDAPDGPVPRGRFENRTRFLFHTVCAAVIVAAGAWALVGSLLNLDTGELTPLYAGEVVSVWAFGLSWLVAGLRRTAPARPGPAGRPARAPVAASF